MSSEGKGKAKMKKILILSANPKDTARLRLDEEVREIEEGLRRSKCRDQFIIQSKWAVRLRDIRRLLLDYEPQILHFCGYGEEDGLKVEDDNGNAIIVRQDALSGLFELFADQIECVLLNACYSAAQAKAINKHINYVIGMSQNVKYKTSIEFAVGFYDALGAGKSVQEAFKFGCNAIHLYNIPGHLVPILLEKKPVYSQTENHENQGRTVYSLHSQPAQIIDLKSGEEGKKRAIPMWRIGLYAALVFLMFLSVIYLDKFQSVKRRPEKEKPSFQGISEIKNLPKTTVEKEEEKQAEGNTTEEVRQDQKGEGNDKKKKGGKIVDTNESPSTPGEITNRDRKNSSNAPVKKKVNSVSKTGNIRKDTCHLPELNNNTSPPLHPTTIVSAEAEGNSMDEACSNARKKAVMKFFRKCPSIEEYQNAFHRMYCNKLKKTPYGRFYVEVKIEFYKKEEK